MKKLTSIIVLAIFCSLHLSAQKSKVTTGVLAQQQNNPDEAIEKLEAALAKPELLHKKPEKRNKPIAKAQYYLSKAYYQVAVDTTKKDQYPDAIFKAKKNLEAALSGPDGKSWDTQSKLGNDHYNIWAVLYNDGVTLFNNGNDEEALKYFVAADEIYPDHFLTNRMLGSAHLVVKDTSKSVEAFGKTLDIFTEKYESGKEGSEELKGTPEYTQDRGQLSYIYRQLAVIHNAQGNTEKALKVLEDGIKMLPEDEDVKRQELSIYQSNPALLDKAKQKFDAALEKNPDDNAIRLAYASLLERAKKNDEAFKLYEDAYKRDPESLQANYGMAAFYINKAAEVSAEKMNFSKDADIDKADQEIKALCEKAYPYVKWLHNQQPEEPEWLSQLVNITPIIGKNDEMMEYAKKLGEINRQN